MNMTDFNSYNSKLVIVNKLITRLYTVMIRQNNNSADKILSTFNVN